MGTGDKLKCRLQIRVKPRAKRTAVTGMLGAAFKIDIAAPPVDGKANSELIRFIADVAAVPRSRVRIMMGESHSSKVLEVDGVALEDLIKRLQ